MVQRHSRSLLALLGLALVSSSPTVSGQVPADVETTPPPVLEGVTVAVSLAKSPKDVVPVAIRLEPFDLEREYEVEVRVEGGAWARLDPVTDLGQTQTALPVERVAEVRARLVGDPAASRWVLSEPLWPERSRGSRRIVPPPRETVLIAGDIATCGSTADSATAAIVAREQGLVMTAGDNVYDRGSTAEFAACYEPTWGRFRSRTRPVPGNHDYASPGAAPYFDYFGRAAGPRGRGFYAFDHGTWRVYALNSNCEATGQCRKGSEQYRWLKADLEAHPHRCSLAVLHHPRFSSGPHGATSRTMPLLGLLYDAGVELMVSGHDHSYERFRPRRPWGRVDDAFGIRQFVVGTGGGPLYAWAPKARPDASQVRENRVHGVLRLRLGWDEYAWRFLPVAGARFSDEGRSRCHGGRPSDAASPDDAGDDLPSSTRP